MRSTSQGRSRSGPALPRPPRSAGPPKSDDSGVPVPEDPGELRLGTKPGSEKRSADRPGAFTGAGCLGSSTTSKHHLNAAKQHQMLVSCNTQPSEDPLDLGKTPYFQQPTGRSPHSLSPAAVMSC